MTACGAVVFDLDETLFDHRAAARAGAAAWLATRGVAPSEGLQLLWREIEERWFAAWSRGEISWRGQRRARVRELLGHLGEEPGDEDALDDSFAVYLAAYERSWRPFADAAPALARLADAGLPVAVLTNGADEQQRAKLSACGLADLVGPVLSADLIGAAKPDARAYLCACERLGVDPARVVHVGDRHDLDVLAARAAGLAAVHLDRDGRGPTGETARITGLDELPALLGLPHRDG